MHRVMVIHDLVDHDGIRHRERGLSPRVECRRRHPVTGSGARLSPVFHHHAVKHAVRRTCQEELVSIQRKEAKGRGVECQPCSRREVSGETARLTG